MDPPPMYTASAPARIDLAGGTVDIWPICQIERGATTRVSTVIFFADLRGFTRLADETPGEALLARLNDYLGDLTETIEAHGGQVLKFMGDGLLANFSLEGRDPTAVCDDAIAAAKASAVVAR